MDKYYEPNLEEFHQGFEYERWSNSAHTPENYIKEVFEFVDKDNIWDDDVTNMLACAYNGGDTLRVKLLDKDDIESLGWKHIGGKLMSSAEQIFSKGIYNLYYTQNSKLKITNNDSITIKYYGRFDDECKTLVEQINIKNKSELVKLLKQLGIE